MGKGDKKTKKGKISSGSYGVLRKRKKTALFIAKTKKVSSKAKKEEVVEEKAPAKKPVAKKVATKTSKDEKKEKPAPKK